MASICIFLYDACAQLTIFLLMVKDSWYVGTGYWDPLHPLHRYPSEIARCVPNGLLCMTTYNTSGTMESLSGGVAKNRYGCALEKLTSMESTMQGYCPETGAS